MFSLLPDLTPRDSHTLWYTSSRRPFASTNHHDVVVDPYDQDANSSPNHQHNANTNTHAHRRNTQLIERSLLARLAADEQKLERRRQNVSDFGAAWLKPPGVPKTLYQMREDRREAEEHLEAMRREQLAQELAEAEGGDGDELTAMLGAIPGNQEGMDDVQLDGARDLDADIPEGEDAGFGLSDEEEEGMTDDGDPEYEDLDDEEEAERRASIRIEQAQQRQIMMHRIRFREQMDRHRHSAATFHDEEIDEDSQVLEEDDLVAERTQTENEDMNMEADLDDEIPDAESLGGYEHTDTEADMSSIMADEEVYNQSHVTFAAYSLRPNRFRHSYARSDLRNSLAVSDVLSRDGSSFLEESPGMQRQFPPSARRRRG